jgi:hypothetical protein
MAGGQLEADVGGELTAELLVPLGGVGEEPLVVEVDLTVRWTVTTGMVVLLVVCRENGTVGRAVRQRLGR